MNWPNDIDNELVPLLDQVNRFPGIRTVSSCHGHSKRPPMISFCAEDLEDLPELLYFFDACHTGVDGWSVIARTDCAMSPVSFVVEGSSEGDKATEEVGRIAGCMAEYLDEASANGA